MEVYKIYLLTQYALQEEEYLNWNCLRYCPCNNCLFYYNINWLHEPCNTPWKQI